MTTNTTSQPQHETPTSERSMGMPGLELWRSMVEAHTTRLDKMFVEMERLERERLERAASAIDDVARLVKSSFEYQRELAAEWRKLGLDAARKSAELAGTV